MPDKLQALMNVMKTLVDNEPKPPLHIGEAMNCWTYLALLEEAQAFAEAALYTTTDDELSNDLKAELNMIQSQVRILRKFMINEGVSLPPTSESKPKCESADIPLGVKLTDNEIANGLALKTVAAVLACSSTAAEAIRNDLAIMFVRFLHEKFTYGATLKTMMRKRGWLKVPPYYTPPGMPHKQ